MEGSDQEASKNPRRRFTIWIAALLAVGVVASIGAAITYARSKDLFLERGTRPIVGTVVTERTGPMCVWNELVVTYEVGATTYRRTIAVKGRGFSGVCLAPYFYRRGQKVDLLVLAANPSAVRTRQRWSPSLYQWGVVAVWAPITAVFLWLLVLILEVWKKPPSKGPA